MRKPHRKINIQSQRGYALIITVVILIAATLLVVSGSRSLIVDQTVATTDGDKRLAANIADETLKYVEQEILPEMDKEVFKKIAGKTSSSEIATYLDTVFTANCTNTEINEGRKGEGYYEGLCQAGESPAAQRGALSPCGDSLEYSINGTGGSCTASGVVADGNTTWANPKYVIELVSPPGDYKDNTVHTYRVTVKAWGRSRNTASILEAYYSVQTN